VYSATDYILVETCMTIRDQELFDLDSCCTCVVVFGEIALAEQTISPTGISTDCANVVCLSVCHPCHISPFCLNRSTDLDVIWQVAYTYRSN